MAPIVAAGIEAFDKACAFGTETMKGMDSEKYSNAVCNMYSTRNCEADFDAMRDLIIHDNTLSVKEKTEMLMEITKTRHEYQMMDAKANADEVNDHEEKRGKLAVTIVAGVLTAGVACIPSLVEYASDSKKKANNKNLKVVKDNQESA